MLNGVAAASSKIELRGGAYEPGLEVDLAPLPESRADRDPGAAAAATTARRAPSSDVVMYFRPTCLGAAASRTITLRNPSRVPVSWRWQVRLLLRLLCLPSCNCFHLACLHAGWLAGCLPG